MRGVTWALAILAVVGLAVLALSWHGRVSQTRRLRTELALHIDRGAIGDLDLAQGLGRRLVVADRNDREASAALAFVDAVLAVDYGFDTDREARTLLDRDADTGGHAGVAGSPVAAAARALVLLRDGNWQAAARGAALAAVEWPGTPHPLYALGRVRALSGDSGGGARALKAAIVGSPGFSAARVGWAEVRLDLGDAQAARSTLQDVLAVSPGDLRARLLLDEAEQSLGVLGAETLTAACPPARDRWPPAAVRAGCALARAGRARRAGARTEALARAEEAATAVPSEARLQARVAQVLAQLGAVDRAAAILGRARRGSAPDNPAVAWAALAVDLGRGRATSPPLGPRPADPEARLLAARAALATGGVGALATALDSLGAWALEWDVDLRLLARLRGSNGAAVPVPSDDPVRAYVDGLRERLAGDIPAAAASLRNALSGHGDACRAAGEYVAMLRVLKRGVDPAAWNLLRAENAACVNAR